MCATLSGPIPAVRAAHFQDPDVGALGYTSLGRHRIFGVPAYAALSVAACAVALVDLVRGRTVSVWDTKRSSA